MTWLKMIQIKANDMTDDILSGNLARWNKFLVCGNNATA